MDLLLPPESAGWSLKRRVSHLTPQQREQWASRLSPETIEEIRRGEWWWTSRPVQVPPELGEWLIYLYLAGRGTGKTRSGAEWIVERTQKHPLDASGAPTERLLVGAKIADVRNTLIGGPSGILRVLERKGIKYRFYKSPKPRIVILDTGAQIHGDGAENGDVGRGFNLADVWLDELCIAKGQMVATPSGSVPIEDVRAGDIVDTRFGPRRVSRAWMSGRNRETVVIRAGGRSVTCTGNHPILTGRGWVRADSISPFDIVFIWKKRSLDLRPTSSGPMSGGTGTRGTDTTGSGTECSYTCRCGSASTAYSQTGTKSTISTETSSTTASKTSCSSASRSMPATMPPSGPMPSGSRTRHPRPSARESVPCGAGGSRGRSSATCVEPPSTAPECGRSAAQTTVGEGSRGNLLPVTVESVTTGPATDVYDLTVDGAHEFLVDGLVVHNCKWPKPDESWVEGLMPALRTQLVGDHPRAFVTTTPKPMKLLREWVAANDGSVIVARGSTYDNAENLSPQILAQYRKKYEGTRIGEQEIYGKLLDDAIGELFVLADLNRARVDDDFDWSRLVHVAVGVDPGLTGDGDETGVVVVGSDAAGDMYVLADRTIMGAGKEAAEHCWNVFSEFDAEALVVETNLGRRWMTETFVDIYRAMVDDGDLPKRRGGCPLKEIDAKASKLLRAQPVGMRCQQGRLHMVGFSPKLEDQMVEFDPNDKDSPDRMDALVHAARWLMRQEKRAVKIHTAASVSSLAGRSILRPSGDGFDGMDIHQRYAG